MSFQVGDMIRYRRDLKNNVYNVTNSEMEVAKVIKLFSINGIDGDIQIKVIKHSTKRSFENLTFEVYSRYFEKHPDYYNTQKSSFNI